MPRTVARAGARLAVSQDARVALLLLKLTITPAAIALATVVGRRWGPTMGGWLAGIPFTSAPVALFLALEHGVGFATAAALGILAGTASQAAFALAYAWTALRARWFAALAVGVVAFALCTIGLRALQPPVIPALEIVVGAIALTIALLPAPKRADVAAAAASEAPEETPATQLSLRTDVLVRAAVATAFVVALTALAPTLGPTLAGLLSPLPLFAMVLIVFPHRAAGAGAAIAACRGFAWGLFAPAAFGVVLASLLPGTNLAVALLAALAAALTVQACTLVVLRRFPRR
jgi:hypothetical protein